MPTLGKSLSILLPDLAPDDPSLTRILNNSRSVSLDAGQTMFHVGAECRQFLMILEGSVRVELASLSGRFVTLYRIHEGETCVLMTSLTA